MKRVSASTCDCLPDCQSTDLTYSVTSNNFMWIENSIYKIASQFPESIVYNWASRECDSRNLNLNPLCTLGRGPLPKLWLDGVRCKELSLKFSFKQFLNLNQKSNAMISNFAVEGKEDLWEAFQLNSRLHLKPCKSHEEETPGWADCKPPGNN